MGHSEVSPEREVRSNRGLPKKDRNISNKQSNPTSTKTKGITTNKAQNEQKKEIIKIRAELNDTETNKSRSWFFEKIEQN